MLLLVGINVVTLGQAAGSPPPPPSISLNPVSQSVYAGGTLTFSATASAAPTPTVVWQVSVDGGSSWITIPTATMPNFTTGTLTAFENGWEVRAYFTSVGGSTPTSAATITVLPPITNIVLPSNGVTVSGTQYLDATASPGASQVRYVLTGGTLNNAVIATATPTYYGWLARWNTAGVPNGTYTLNSEVSAGGLTGTSRGVTVTVDNVPLQTQLLLPKGGSNISGNVIFDATAQGANVTGVYFVVTFGSLRDYQFLTATPTYYGWIGEWNSLACPPGFPNGSYVFQSVVTQAGGVTAMSTPVAVTLNNTTGGCP